MVDLHREFYIFCKSSNSIFCTFTRQNFFFYKCITPTFMTILLKKNSIIHDSIATKQQQQQQQQQYTCMCSKYLRY